MDIWLHAFQELRNLETFVSIVLFALNLTSQVFSPTCQTALSYPTPGVLVGKKNLILLLLVLLL